MSWLFAQSKRLGITSRFFGFSLACFALALGGFIAGIKIPPLIMLILALMAVCFELMSILIYWADIRQHFVLKRLKVALMLATQPLISLFLFFLMYLSPTEDWQRQGDAFMTLLTLSLITAFVFFVVFAFIINYISGFSNPSYASPFMLMGVILPGVLNLTAFICFISSYPGPTSLAGMLLTTFIISVEFYQNRALIVSPYDRRVVLDAINQGWMIVDRDEIILDMNDAAEKITGQSSASLIGKSGKDLVSNWSTLFPDSLFSEKELQASINHHDRWFYFQVRSLPLLHEGEFAGRILIWNDVTERKKSGDLRASAVDPTLGLLHSISLVASHTTDIQSFLETAIFQIVGGFNCSLGFIFMREIEFIGEEKASLELVGTYSVFDLPEAEKIAQAVYPMLSRFDGVVHLKSSEIQTGGQAFSPDAGLDELVICPLVLEAQTQGAIVLFRAANSPFISDEVMRLEMLSNELSTLIQVERQRHGYAAMAERKKLVRVLHDTVTQQLYGLLYFIDVAQAQLDFGTINSLSSTLERLGETGRQALKEMRMFLYSLQPVSVSRIGLIKAINQRLDAVEGRASVKTKFQVVGEVKLSLKQEICLYDITLEALNNILRHALAKNVAILLKQTPKTIHLEILDDGRGFDLKTRKNSGGIGLKNMRESAKQIHARITFRSEVGKGTCVTIVLPRSRAEGIEISQA